MLSSQKSAPSHTNDEYELLQVTASHGRSSNVANNDDSDSESSPKYTNNAGCESTEVSDIDFEINVGSHKVIYLYSIPSLTTHEGLIKVGDATLKFDGNLGELLQSSEQIDDGLYTNELIQNAAHKRIKEQVGTSSVEYTLEAAFLAIRPNAVRDDAWDGFRDYDLHEVLLRNGVKKVKPNGKTGQEWFKTDKETVLNASVALVKGNVSFAYTEHHKIVLRPEQRAAVDKTKKVFVNGTVDEPNRFLWNAIMRFGKTVSALTLMKELNLNRIFIVTHRPVVEEGWWKDYHAVFAPEDGWKFASKRRGEKWDAIKNDEKYIYFASVQDLRGSFDEPDSGVAQDLSESEAEELFTKNAEVFATEWDAIILDEAHEGLSTELAEKMFNSIKARNRLDLSGTPFNIIDNYDAHQVFNWSYIDEQKAKREWVRRTELDENDPDFTDAPNPYARNVELEIRTYDISKIFEKSPEVAAIQDSIYFNFSKFFEVDTRVTKTFYDPFQKREVSYHPFIWHDAVHILLDMMNGKNDKYELDVTTGLGLPSNKIPSSMPFANSNAWVDFADTFWLLPNINATKALHAMLLEHPVFSLATIVNVSGNNDSGDPLGDVNRAIKDNQRTITLSIGKLTTGTSVPAWSAVFMLSNLKSAMLYMQAAYRAKTAGSLRDGRPKETAYIFDFAPDRALEVMAATGRATSAAKIKENNVKVNVLQEDLLNDKYIEEWLRFLPIISYNGAEFVLADSHNLMRTLNRVFIEDNVKSGFFSLKLFNRDMLASVPEKELNMFRDLGLSVGPSAATEKKSINLNVSKIAENMQKMKECDDRKKAAAENCVDVDKKTEKANEKEYDAIAKKVIEDRRQMTLILRAVAVRLPLMVLAMNKIDYNNLETNITVDNFTDLVDDDSWAEFMPQGFYKKRTWVDGVEQPSWESLNKYFDKSIFSGSIGMLQGKVDSIHNHLETPIELRPLYLAQLFNTFQNPDKETILTPFTVVNLQYGSTVGGLRWVNQENQVRVERLIEPVGQIEHVSIDDAVAGIEDGVYELALEWATSEVDPVENDELDFWEDPNTTIFDMNSKTALYLIYGAASLFYARRRHREGKYIGKRIINPYRDVADNETQAEDLRLWKEVVETQIFANSRVPYSRKIAERVLRGYDENATVNAAVVDLVKVGEHMRGPLADMYYEWCKKTGDKRKKVEISSEWNSVFIPRLERWLFGKDWEKSIESKEEKNMTDPIDFNELEPPTPEEIAEVEAYASFFLEQADAAEESTQDEASDSQQPRHTTPTDRAEILLSIDSLENEDSNRDDSVGFFNLVDFDWLMKQLEDNDADRFTFGISNPPYTKENAGVSDVSIYPLFIQTGMNTNQMSSVLTPARWMNSAKGEFKTPREAMVDRGCNFRSFHHFTDRLFTTVDISGGLSFYLYDRLYSGKTKMFLNNDLQRIGKLFDSTKIISTDEMGEIRERLSDSVLQKVGREMKRWLIVENGYFPEGVSTEAFIINSSPTRKSPTDVRMRINGRDGWRYFSENDLEERYYTPEGKCAFAFKHTCGNGSESMNDYSAFLTGRESAKAAMALIFDTPEQVRAFYRYARTKFFNRLVVSRLSSHSAYPQAYQDVPLFTFTETDGIDWDASIPELDKALIKHFGLEEHEAYFMAVEKPYARAFDDEMLAKLEAAGVDVTGINEWYEE